MKPLALIIPCLLALCGCGSITRAEWDAARAEYDVYVTEFPVTTDAPDGTKVLTGEIRVIHHGNNPSIDFRDKYTNPSGIRVATFRDGVLVGRYFQEDLVMAK